MLSENAKKWVAALRSGMFKQAKNHLHIKGVGYCCLGVACEVAIDAGIPLQISTKALGKDGGRVLVSYDAAVSGLPVAVRQWLGLRSHLGTYPDPTGNNLYEGLTWGNDHGKTFDELADIIESEPAGLFR